MIRMSILVLALSLMAFSAAADPQPLMQVSDEAMALPVQDFDFVEPNASTQPQPLGLTPGKFECNLINCNNFDTHHCNYSCSGDNTCSAVVLTPGCHCPTIAL